MQLRGQGAGEPWNKVWLPTRPRQPAATSSWLFTCLEEASNVARYSNNVHRHLAYNQCLGKVSSHDCRFTHPTHTYLSIIVQTIQEAHRLQVEIFCQTFPLSLVMKLENTGKPLTSLNNIDIPHWGLSRARWCPRASRA